MRNFLTNLKFFIFFEFFSENVLKSLLRGRETTRKKYQIVFEKFFKYVFFSTFPSRPPSPITHQPSPINHHPSPIRQYKPRFARGTPEGEHGLGTKEESRKSHESNYKNRCKTKHFWRLWHRTCKTRHF